jgi:hypothetical protein
MSQPKFTVLFLAITFAVLAATSANAESGNMKIRIEMNGNEITATLTDNATSRDFVSLLPLKLKLEDYGETEKIGYLPKKLSTEGAPPGSDPSVGDVSYYAPWGNLAIFRKDFRYSTGLINLGRIDSGLEALSVPGSVEVTIDLVR